MSLKFHKAKINAETMKEVVFSWRFGYRSSDHFWRGGSFKFIKSASSMHEMYLFSDVFTIYIVSYTENLLRDNAVKYLYISSVWEGMK